MEFGVNRGQKAEVEIKLYNPDEQNSIVIYCNAANFTAGKEAGVPEINLDAPKEDISSWIKVPTGPITLEAKGRYTIPITVDVPESAAPGGHYGVVLFSNNPPDDKNSQGGTIAVTSAVGSLMLVRVDGAGAFEAGVIQNFKTSGNKSFYYSLPVGFITDLQNTGNIHLKPVGEIAVYNILNRFSAKLNFNTENGYVLPNTTRTYEKEVWQKAQLEQSASNGWDKFWQAYQNEKNNFAFGKYTARLNIQAGVEKSFSLSAATTFWVFPIHIIIVWLVIIIILVILIILLIKKYNRWIIKKAGKSGEGQVLKEK